MKRAELCAFLWLDPAANAHVVRAAVARIMSQPQRLGTASLRRDELARRLGLSNSASPIAIQRVVESVLASPLRRTKHHV